MCCSFQLDLFLRGAHPVREDTSQETFDERSQCGKAVTHLPEVQYGYQNKTFAWQYRCRRSLHAPIYHCVACQHCRGERAGEAPSVAHSLFCPSIEFWLPGILLGLMQIRIRVRSIDSTWRKNEWVHIKKFSSFCSPTLHLSLTLTIWWFKEQCVCVCVCMCEVCGNTIHKKKKKTFDSSQVSLTAQWADITQKTCSYFGQGRKASIV